MALRIVFGIMSATQSAAAVTQLAEVLDPHRVVVHHDYEKRADFRVDAPNVEMVTEPKVTGWGTWGFSEAIFHTVRYALEHHDFDYFQLLSPTCLPIRPVEEFEAFVATDPADAHVDRMEVDGDDDTLMTFGYRTYLPGSSLRFRLLRRARSWYFGDDSDLVQTQSLSMLKRRSEPGGRPSSLGARAGLALTRWVADGRLGGHPFGPGFRPMIGGVFFGARRNVCEHLVRMSEGQGSLEFFRGLHIVDETLFPTLLANSGFTLGPSNHAINAFNAEGSPRWIEPADLDTLIATGRYFGRKFIDDPDAPIRQRVLELVGAHAVVR
jgi:hypothetical protein